MKEEKKIFKCPFTGFEGVVPTENKMYCNQGKKYIEVLNELGFVPINDYNYLEKLKTEGHSMVRSKNSKKQMIGYTMVVYSHYCRSFSRAIDHGYWRAHPKFDKYIAMVEYGNNVFPQELVDRVRVKYGKIDGQIKPGKTYWQPKGS